MIKINVEVKQLRITQSIEVKNNQKGSNILQLLFNKLNFDYQIRQHIICILKVENVEVDLNKTINELKINDYSIIEVELSKKIVIECEHKYLGLIKFNTDAFASVNKFKNYLIKELIKINSQIVITDSQNGTQLGDEAWSKYGIFQDIKVIIQITKQQKLIFNQTHQEITIDIFHTIAMILHQYINKFNFNNNEIIAFKINNQCINPDEVYKNLNLPIEQPWNVEITNKFTFRISLDQQGTQLITIDKEKDVFDLIRIAREVFKIEKTIPLKLEYKLNNYILDIYQNTIQQECIPTYSHLNLIKEPSDNKINILLFNIQTMDKQIIRVDINQPLSNLDQQIHINDAFHIIEYYVNNQTKSRTLTLKELDLKSESIVEYEIKKNDEQFTIIFENKYTKKQTQRIVKSTSIVNDALKEVVLQENQNQDINYYQVYLNNNNIDKNSRFDSLQIVQNQKLIYFTDFIELKAYVDKLQYTQIVDQNLTISQIEEQFKINHGLGREVSFQNVNLESKNMTLKQFLFNNPNFIFECNAQKQSTKQLIFQIFITQLSQNHNFYVNQESICQALFEQIKKSLKLPNNQVIKVQIGDKQIDPSETIQSIYQYIEKSQQQLTVDLLTQLNLLFENKTLKTTKIVQVELEDTLEEATSKNNINASKFYYQQKLLNIKKKFKDLPIENNSIIEYQSNLMMFENNKTRQIYQIEVQTEDTLQILVDRLELKIDKFYYKNQILDLSTKIKNLSLNENIMFDEYEMQELHEPSETFSQSKHQSQVMKEINVTVVIGDLKLTYKLNSSLSFSIIKETVFNQMLKDQGADKNMYYLFYNEIKVDESQPISNLCKGNQIELQFQLSY